jgi:hypothetical protein
MEMRLYVPPKHRRLQEKIAAKTAEAGSDGEEGEEVEADRSTAEVRVACPARFDAPALRIALAFPPGIFGRNSGSWWY